MVSINPNAKPSFVDIGTEGTKAFIIDDFLSNTQAIITHAQQQQYEAIAGQGNHYPGARADVEANYGNTLIRSIAPVLYNFYKTPKQLQLFPISGSYSLITQQEHQLNLENCIPHFDSPDSHKFAVLHYLNPGTFCGTGFFRHKPTRYENITRPRLKSYLNSVQEFIDKEGAPQRGYINQSSNHYELIDSIAYKPNRVVIYPTTILHSALVNKPDRDINSDPNTGRLTANFFIEFK